MADGRVVIEIEMEDGSVVKGVADLKKQLGGIPQPAQKAESSIKNMVTSLGLVKVAAAGLGVLKNSLDAAISRFDTMERFPKVLGALGFSAEESGVSVDKLADGIDGLPTKLDEVVSTAQRMTAITGNLNRSTDATLALNNAMLASGASTADANRGMEQYIQMLSTGQVDLQSWKTLQETMPIGLQKTAEAMGYVGETAQRDLYDALKAGEITFRDFESQLIKLGTGTGELAELAKVNSEGIATSFGNLKNAVSKGLANILKSFDNLSKAVTGQTIAKNIDGMKVVINAAFKSMGTAIELTTPLFKVFASVVKGTVSVGKTLSPVLMGVAVAYGALKIIDGINSLILGNHAALQMAAMSGKALTIVTKGKMAAQIADTTATKADVIAKSAQNGVISISTALIGVLTGGISAHTVVTTLATAATTAFSTALKVMTGPIGWVVAGIGTLVAAGTALFKWLNKETEASKQLNKEQSKLVDSTQQLADATKQNSINRKDEISHLENSKKAYQDVAKSVSDLASKEKLTAGEKKSLKEQIEQLNQAYGDLNLQYSEETGNLSMSTEALKQKIAAYGDQDKLIESQQQLLDISKEQNEVDAKIKEISELREEWNQKLEDGVVKKKEAKEATKELDEQETILKENQAALKDEFTSTQETLTNAMNSVTEATENGVLRQVVSYESLSEAQRTAVDGMREKWLEYSEAATEMFDTLSDKQEMSVAQMTSNMEENQRVISEWADNIAILAERGVDEGLLNKLRDAGPESAGHVAAMVGASDEELQKMNEVFKNGGTTATTALKTAFDTEGQGVSASVEKMITGVSSSLKTSIAAADFKSLGKEVPSGVAKGITDSTSDAKDSSEKLAKETSSSFKNELAIHSPSKKFMDFGKNIVQGLTNGINNNSSNAKSAITKVANSLRTTFNPLPSQMRSIGAQIMSGLASGIYANSGVAISAANSVASRIKATIQRAMDINSPSRWMKNFIGKNMMVGWGDGIDLYSKLPISSMQKAVSQIKLPAIRAEQVIGNAPVFAGVGHSIINNTNNNYNQNHKYPPIYIENVLEVDGKEIARSTAPYTEKELERFTKRRMRKDGDR
ncbi:tape measure protein [Vagococcus elongatus]|uniref:Tape measure protein n=1 Tax=Vagococcus elongatus TaxID=180344 RepID=A0A430AU36_9ENTE|nr:tape measure protein [Vagococcus elongatus]RSU11565.1 tape measure protein [Vagococcus elongatus]